MLPICATYSVLRGLRVKDCSHSLLFIVRPKHKHLIVKTIMVLTISESFPFHLRRSLNPYPISAYKLMKMN